ncbi:uncharacterized protein LOC124494811 isoform X2 [Dermatophagoides farinae]|uniref:uncharacterized protein LOC124494811 isoform X2 n=1 Tax=Dermatophagoides farinae TaxID=6954 RepID=UPI003F64738A
MSSSNDQHFDVNDKLGQRSMKFDQNQNPVNNGSSNFSSDEDGSNENGFVNLNNLNKTATKSQASLPKSDGADSVRKFNESMHSLNLWIWQCQTWIYFHGAYHARIQQQHQQIPQSRTTNFGPSMVVKLSSIRKRLLAGMIDYFFIHFLYDQFRMLIAELFDYDIPFTTMDFKELETFFPEDDDGLEDLLPKIFWIYIKSIQYSTMFYLFDLIYETLFLYGWPNRTYPGATIGKRIMGLRVVSCNHLESISMAVPNIVRVMPAGNITLGKAFIRTLIKLMPVNNTIQSLYILTSRYNRSYFDKRMGLLVVDMSAPAMAQVAAVMTTTNTNNTPANPLPQQQQQQQQQQQPPNLNRAFL